MKKSENMVCGFATSHDRVRYRHLLIVVVLAAALACERRQDPPPPLGPAPSILSPAALHELRERQREADAYGHGCMHLRELGLLATEARCHHLTGRQRAKREDREAARAFYALSLASWRLLGNRHEIAVLAFDLADVERQLGRPERAETLLSETHAIATQQGDTLLEARATTALGSLHHALGRTSTAITELRRALQLLEEHPPADARKSKAQRAITLSQLGAVLPFVDDPSSETLEEALALLERARRLRRELGADRGLAVTLNNLGLVQERMQRFEAALASYQEALDLLHAPGDEAERAVVGANRCRALEGLGELEAADVCHRAALAAVRKIGYLNAEAQILYASAENQRRRGVLDRAQVTIEESIEVVERMRGRLDDLDLRSSFLAKKLDVYGLAIDVALDRHLLDPGAGHDAEAFLFAESASVRSLLDSLGDERAAVPAIFSAAEVQRHLDPQTLFLEYHLGVDRSAVWAITRDAIACFLLPDRGEIEATAIDYYQALSAGGHMLRARRADRLGKTLSQLILAPIADRLDRPRIVIVANGALAYVPFAALPHPEHVEAENPRPLILDHTVVSAPSASAVAAIGRRLSDRTPARKLLAIVAAPTFTRASEKTPPGFSPEPLPFAEEEAWAIFAMADGPSLLALGPAANRNLVLGPELRDYQILHFATHGDLDDAHGQLSSLALSSRDERGRPIDGSLRAEEIARLDLHAELVVLSACETALGEEIRGEGVVGLTRSFLKAGARQVLVSLWRVDDKATARLMEGFYRGYLREGLAPDEALRRAQLELRAQGWAAAYYWAPFTLQGDWVKSPRPLPR